MQSVLNIQRHPPAATARPEVRSTGTSTRGLEMGLLMACLALLALGAWGPSIAQTSHYHAFANQRALFGVPNMMDVLSNLAFAGFGLVGAWRIWRLPQGAISTVQRSLADLALLSLFAGLYSVLMYALIQIRSQPTHRARIIAANNILNALFMIASSIIAGALLSAGFTIPQIFLFVGLANAVVAAYIFLLVPEYLMRFVAWIITRCIYRFKVTGDDNIPTTGAAILACNHVSFIDAVLLLAASPRPIYSVMEHRIFKIPVLGTLFKLANAIPIAPRAEDPQAYEAALAAAQKVLKEGDLLAIFPEGGLTLDGKLQEFKGGIMKILEREPVPVIPMALTNLWGSYFSRVEQGDAMVRPFRRGMFSRVGLQVGTQLPPHEVRPDVLHAHVAGLLARA